MEQLIMEQFGTLTISIWFTIPDLNLPVMGKGKSKDILVYRNVTEEEAKEICKQFKIVNPYPVYEAICQPVSTIISM